MRGPVQRDASFDSAATRPGSGGETTHDWKEHEHTSVPAELEAQKLVDVAGSVELAKQAVDSAAQHAAATTAGPTTKEQFAQQLGFVSFLEMFEASKPVKDSNDLPWYVTPIQTGEWIVWNERNLVVAQRHPAVEEAIAWVQRRGP